MNEKKNMGSCVICGKKTKYIMNIEFKKTPICNSCANTIAMQQLHWLSEEVEATREINEILDQELKKEGKKE